MLTLTKLAVPATGLATASDASIAKTKMAPMVYIDVLDKKTIEKVVKLNLVQSHLETFLGYLLFFIAQLPLGANQLLPSTKFLISRPRSWNVPSVVFPLKMGGVGCLLDGDRCSWLVLKEWGCYGGSHRHYTSILMSHKAPVETSFKCYAGLYILAYWTLIGVCSLKIPCRVTAIGKYCLGRAYGLHAYWKCCNVPSLSRNYPHQSRN